MVGAGYIAVEMAGILKSLGSDVSLVIRYDSVLRSFDKMISTAVTKEVQDMGINLMKSSKIVNVEKKENGPRMEALFQIPLGSKRETERCSRRGLFSCTIHTVSSFSTVAAASMQHRIAACGSVPHMVPPSASPHQQASCTRHFR